MVYKTKYVIFRGPFILNFHLLENKMKNGGRLDDKRYDKVGSTYVDKIAFTLKTDVNSMIQ